MNRKLEGVIELLIFTGVNFNVNRRLGYIETKDFKFNYNELTIINWYLHEETEYEDWHEFMIGIAEIVSEWVCYANVNVETLYLDAYDDDFQCYDGELTIRYIESGFYKFILWFKEIEESGLYPNQCQLEE